MSLLKYALREFIIDNVENHPRDIVRLSVDKFKVSRQHIHAHINSMINEGIIRQEGKTSGTKYFLKYLIDERFDFDTSKHREEDKLWDKYIFHLIDRFPKNIRDICQYGFTEMYNNIIDHSESKKAIIHLYVTQKNISILIIDYGIGIFHKIKSVLNMKDERDAILELSKGKLTTDPERHSGEGIFFTSRMFDDFMIFSGGLFFSHTPVEDWILLHRKNRKGTVIQMSINMKSNRKMTEIFNAYTSDINQEGIPAFAKTIIAVDLLRYGTGNLVSRSQAKRLLVRLEDFKEVVLNFENVDMIGQAFADEIFRVYQNSNPNIKIGWVKANKEVEGMILRAKYQMSSSGKVL
tara:strand:- start:9624 stop:10673 length:1050 start_codon:yes stop_codon:yes gene_type:complete